MQIYSHFYSNDTKTSHVVHVVQLNSALNKSTCGVYETKYNSLQKTHIQICLSTQVLFFKEQKLTFLVNITGPSEARTLRHWN